MTKPLAFIGTRTGADGMIRAAELLGIPVAGWFDRYYHGNTSEFLGYPILGSDLDITAKDREKYVFFLGSSYSGHSLVNNPEHNSMRLRLERIRIIREQNLPLINLIHPSAYIDKSATIGQGVYLGHNSLVSARCYVGDFSYLCHMAAIGHDVTLNGNNILLCHSVIGGNVLLEEDVMLGMNSTVAPASGETLIIGHGSKVAAGAVVYRSVPANKFVSVQGRMLSKLDKI